MKIDQELSHIIQLIMGDFGGDGHDKTRNIVIISNLSVNDIKNAYKLGVEIIGFDLINEIAIDYEDSKISYDQIKKYFSVGLIEKMYWDWHDAKNQEKEGIYLDSEMYIDLYLFTVLIGNDRFRYNFLNYDSRINIGGYGLFY